MTCTESSGLKLVNWQMKDKKLAVWQSWRSMDMSWIWTCNQWHAEPYTTEEAQAADFVPCLCDLNNLHSCYMGVYCISVWFPCYLFKVTSWQMLLFSLTAPTHF
jgi:hypothetical protein